MPRSRRIPHPSSGIPHPALSPGRPGICRDRSWLVAHPEKFGAPSARLWQAGGSRALRDPGDAPQLPEPLGDQGRGLPVLPGAAAVTSLLTGSRFHRYPGLAHPGKSSPPLSACRDRRLSPTARLSQPEPGTAAEQRSGTSPGVPPVVSPRPRGWPSGVRLGSGLSSARFQPYRGRPDGAGTGRGAGVGGRGRGRVWAPAGPGDPHRELPVSPSCRCSRRQPCGQNGGGEKTPQKSPGLSPKEPGRTWPVPPGLRGHRAAGPHPQPGTEQRLGPGRASRWVLCQAGG